MILVKLDHIKGDSKIPGYENCIACTSCSWNIERTFSESAKAGTMDVNVGTAEIPPITLGKSFDTASVDLMSNAISGGALGDTAYIYFLSTAGVNAEKPAKFLEYKLHNPIVASWSISGEEDERPTEEMTLWYWKIWMQYFTSTDGKNYKAAGSRGWDRTQNKPWSG